MDITEMKDLWKATPTENTAIESLEKMIREKSNPLLLKIKRQLLVEMFLWLAVIMLYQSAFDGDKRPAAINLVFVIGFLQAIAYNLSSYFAARNLTHGSNLFSSFTDYSKKLKKLQWTSICSRISLMIALLVFFSYDLEMTSKRIFAIGVIITIFGFQLLLLYWHWSKRISKLTRIVTSIDN